MFKIAILFLITFSQLNGLNNESIIGPSKHFTNSSNVDFNGIKNASNFNFLVPRNHGYKFEIKEPYPLVPGQSISRVRLHYFDKSGQKYMFGIEEHKASGYKIKRNVTTIDVRNQRSTTKTNIEEFRFDLIYTRWILTLCAR